MEENGRRTEEELKRRYDLAAILITCITVIVLASIMKSCVTQSGGKVISITDR